MARCPSSTERAGRVLRSWPAGGANALLLCASLALGGCLAPWARQPEPVPNLGGQVLVQPASPLERRSGSLWRNNVPANFLFTDVRAAMTGDLLTVVVVENDSGAKEAATETNNEASVLEGIGQFFGLPQALQAKNPDIDPTQLIQAESERTWEGSGATARSGTLTARMTVEVKAVSPTGNLWVQGDKVVSVNNEDQHIVLSGWVRPEDIDARNEVASTRLAQARIDYYGVGEVGRQQRAGWGMIVLDYVWPF